MSRPSPAPALPKRQRSSPPGVRAGEVNPDLILASYLHSRGLGPAPDGPFDPSLTDDVAALSLALEKAFDEDPRQKRHGVYSTSPDVADYLARNTIVPVLLDRVGAGRLFPGRGSPGIDDLVTSNLDLQSCLLDWIADAKPRLVGKFWEALQSLTILDPACGTGAFLLAGLRVLAPLYAACMERLATRPRGDDWPASRDCGAVRLVLRNLHGNDLLPEATDIAALRLKLELARWANVPSDLNSFADVKKRLKTRNALLGSTKKRFDVVLCNPPYLEIREVDYRPTGFRCQETGAIHALFVERSLDLLKPRGRAGLVLPMAVASTQRMRCVQDLIEEGRSAWYSHFAWRPGRLFPGVHRAVTLVLTSPAREPRTYSTGYLKWRSRERPQLIERIAYTEVPRDRPSFWVPKLSCESERSLLDRMLAVPTTVGDFVRDDGEHRVYYRTDGGLYWKVFTDFPPAFSLNGRDGHSTRETWLAVPSAGQVVPLIAALSSHLFWWWYTVTSNCRHLNPSDVRGFPLPASALEDRELARLGRAYLREITSHSAMRVRVQQQTGRTETQSFRIRRSRRLIDRIDAALAPHYGLDAVELGLVIRYDRAFRMGAGVSRP